MLFVSFSLLAVITTLTTLVSTDSSNLKFLENSFTVDYEANQFLLDGKPFRYVSGSFHYFRTPNQYWRAIFKKMRAAGLNAVSTYIEWSTHEPEPGKWIWKDDANITQFIQIAEEEDLLVILRPGPYICAERDLGGLPTWLLNVTSEIKLRTNDRWYMKYVQRYLETVLIKIKSLLRGNGGPIIMVQIENEYGTFNACDFQYKNALREIFFKHVESNAVLFTTDGLQETMLQCGIIPGVFATIDFGPSTNVSKNFQTLRKFQPKGPLVNSEYYPGWLTHWGEPMQKVSTLKVVKTLDEILSVGASVNIYMFFGGTNFGFKSGANTDPNFRPLLTSYDYDAPLTEAGDVTPKYFAMRDVIKSYMPLEDLPIPAGNKKKNYGITVLESVINLFDPVAKSLFGTIVVQTNKIPNFEELQILPLQLVLFETQLPLKNETSTILKTHVHDRCYVYINRQLTGILSRMDRKFDLTIHNPYEKHLTLLVLNEGHVNYGGNIKDYKGLFNVSLSEETSLTWNVTGFTLENVKQLFNVNSTIPVSECLRRGPTFYRSTFLIKENPVDTFLDTSGWGKGVAYINGYNIGRYWPLIGPQITLYIPGVILKLGKNELIVLEYEYASKSHSMEFINHAKFVTSVFLENNANNCTAQ
ncbi:beta-galactosidase-like isoform X2 [Leptopilina heterotoma]|uniref:beta-galactosidase-like isoform X2 n=1 Tax=Leptopilina heterotoma TaxID=63436 RepID=UPI001CA9516D|nr:beta-galactosidase-like isoform X2 [Leptopilina heterotoma]